MADNAATTAANTDTQVETVAGEFRRRDFINVAAISAAGVGGAN